MMAVYDMDNNQSKLSLKKKLYSEILFFVIIDAKNMCILYYMSK